MPGIKHVLPMVAILLAGCAPQLGPEPVPAAPSSFATAESFAGPHGAWPAADWWRAFGDPTLDALIEEALRGSPDVAAAAARVRAANAAAEQAGAALSPQLSAEAMVGGAKQSYNLGIPPQFVPKGIISTGRLTGIFNFDLDLWGRNRALLRAATSDAQAADVDAAQARLVLSTAVAAAYADLARLYAERDLAEEAIRLRGETARLTSLRVTNGLDTRGELRQAESRVPSSRADLGALDEAIALDRNRIAALLGAGPDRGRTIPRPQLTAAAIGLPDRLALDLIGRRPDIVSARLRAEAAASRIKAAHAAFYPDINLAAVAGFQSLGLDKLLEGGSSYGNAGPALSLPIFSGGRLEGQYRGARANYDLAVAQYDSTLVTALREVADAVASLKALDAQIADQQQAVAAAEDASRIARLRYQGGLANQLSVLASEDQLIASRRALADLQSRRLALDVALVRALGGGFVAPDSIATGAH